MIERRSVLSTIVVLASLVTVSTVPAEPSDQELAQKALLAYVDSLFSLADLYKETGSYGQAEQLYQTVIDTFKATVGEENSAYAVSLYTLAVLYNEMGLYGKAEPLYLQALDIFKGTFGTEHFAFAKGLNGLAGLYNEMGLYGKAEPLYLQALDIFKGTFGTEHFAFAKGLNGLAGLYNEMGLYGKAEPLYLQALRIRKVTLGEDDPQYAYSLHNLAGLYNEMGLYGKAEPLYLQALDIFKAIGREEHSDYAASLDGLAGLYNEMGLYAKAEPLYRQALAIRKAMLGDEHPGYADSLHNLAGLFQQIGSNKQAERLYQKALDIYKAKLGEEHPEYADTLNDLALLYEKMGSYGQAQSLYYRALDIYKAKLGEEHPAYAASVHNLATMYGEMGEFALAEPFHRKGLEIKKDVLGEKHPHYAASLCGLAVVYKEMGSYGQAEPLFRQALAIDKATLGEEHAGYGGTLHNLAGLYMYMGLYEQAVPLSRQALAIIGKNSERTALVQSEQQQLEIREMVRYQLDAYLSLALLIGDMPQAAFEHILLWKGATLVRQRQYRQAASDPAVAEVFTRLQAVTRRLASLARAYPARQEEVADWRDQLRALNAERDRLEAELSRTGDAFRQAQHKVTVAEVAGALPQNAVLVDFLEFAKWTPSSSPTTTRSLLASVLRPDGEVTLIDLGSQEVVAQAIETWRQSFGLSEQGMKAGRLLRQRVWEPLLPALGTAKTVLISLDSVLGRLPLGALPGDTPGTYLLEDYALAFLPVPQLLPKLSEQRQHQEDRRLLLVGGVNYDARQSEGVVATRSAVKSDPLMMAQLRGGTHFGPLDATLPEVTNVKNLFQMVFQPPSQAISLLSQAAATEEQFRNLAPRFDFLHLATHGFFAPPRQPSAQALAQAARAQRSAIYGREALVVQGTDPGLLSGVVLSGANQPPQPEQDDGILTATEIAMLPLAGVDLVVLSACETGLGETAGGEGLLGVQRAFQVAGARSTVASLWKVPDQETRLLMERFYHNLWEEQLSGLEALREAQLWMLKNTDVPNSTEEERSAAPVNPTTSSRPNRSSPLYWAAFQLSGDWR